VSNELYPTDKRYPTDKTLKDIEEFELKSDLSGVPEMVSLIVANWEYPLDSIFYHESTGILELHTIGWSGNERIIRAIRNNLFLRLFWLQSRRGGHHIFELFQFDEKGRKCMPKFYLDAGEVVISGGDNRKNS